MLTKSLKKTLSPTWWKTAFGASYIALYGPRLTVEDTKKEVDFIEQNLKLKKGAKILDLACGQGRHAIELASRGYDVTGVDYSSYLLSLAKKNMKDKGVKMKFVRGDMRSLGFKNEFDVVVNLFTAFGYFHKESDHIKTLRSVCRSLKEGGIFLLDTVNPDFLKKHFIHGVARPLQEGKGMVEHFFTTDKRWIMRINSGKNSRVSSTRVFDRSELKQLFNTAGFTVKKMWGNFSGNQVSNKNRRIIILGQKKAPA